MVNHATMSAELTPRGVIGGTVTSGSEVSGTVEKGNGPIGTSDYNRLKNQPSINTHTLIGDSNFEDIGLHFMTNVELKELLGG